jgi:hypothetical protein
MGVYGICFLLLAVMSGKHADATGYSETVPFVMDTGNPYRRHVVDAQKFLTTIFQHLYPIHAGNLTFVGDTDDPAIEAADVIAWNVRRKLVSQFNNGVEPLAGILGEHHMEARKRPSRCSCSGFPNVSPLWYGILLLTSFKKQRLLSISDVHTAGDVLGKAANVHLGSKRQVANILRDLRRRESNWLRSAAGDMAKALHGDWKTVSIT